MSTMTDEKTYQKKSDALYKINNLQDVIFLAMLSLRLFNIKNNITI